MTVTLLRGSSYKLPILLYLSLSKYFIPPRMSQANIDRGREEAVPHGGGAPADDVGCRRGRARHGPPQQRLLARIRRRLLEPLPRDTRSARGARQDIHPA